MIKGLIPSQFRNFYGEFTDLETEKLFVERQKTQPVDWEYNTKKIFYKYNSQGHRSVEIEELGDNYILTTGCSNTEGVGLAYEDTWSYLVAKHLDKQFYNCAVGGSGPYVTCKNIMLFLSYVKKHPEMIIIQWPFFARFFRIQGVAIHIHHLTPASYDENREYYEMLLKDDDAFNINLFERQLLISFLENINYQGKIIEMFTQDPHEMQKITLQVHDLDIKQIMIPRPIDTARDLVHPGSKSNKIIANLALRSL